MTRPLVLFGGTFDPPHRRHVQLAETVRDLLDADEVLLMVAKINPQRMEHPPASAADRFAMVQAAVKGRRALVASDLELRREGPSFTVETLRTLRAGGERRPIRLLIGSDQALNLRTWREPEAIIEMATPAIALRPPHTPHSFERGAISQGQPHLLQWVMPIDPVECSSTEARRRLAAGQPTDDLLDPAVKQIIVDRGLYGREAP